MKDRDPSELDPNEFRKLLEKRAAEIEQRKQYGQLSQGRSAIVSAVIILFIVDVLAVLLLVWVRGTSATYVFRITDPAILSIAIDLFLGINLLRGKSWARTWMLIRVVVGLLIFGGMAMAQQDYPTLVIQGGYCVALLILLTGITTRFRLTSGISLFVVSFVTGLVLALMPPSVATEEDFLFVEPKIPSHYSTYTSEGLFSISYPPDWELGTSVMEEVFEELREWTEEEAPELAGQMEDVRMIFLALDVASEESVATVGVFVYPKPVLVFSLDAIVQNENQWAEEKLQQYHEYSQLKTTVDGREAIISDYSHYDPQVGAYQSLQLYTIKSSLVWTVLAGCILEDFKDYEGTFDQIVRSLRILK